MDIYEVLNEIITEPHYYSMSRLFANVDNSTIEDNDRILFELLKNISSMGTHVTKMKSHLILCLPIKMGAGHLLLKTLQKPITKFLKRLSLTDYL